MQIEDNHITFEQGDLIKDCEDDEIILIITPAHRSDGPSHYHVLVHHTLATRLYYLSPYNEKRWTLLSSFV